jgi:asparagine synthase (glutamine-hydrolysing)
MCGIAGIFDAGRRPSRCDLEPMVSALVHRGPDAAGHFVDDMIALGMRRLSIIDLSGGDQPIFNEDGSIGVVFNGEIFNYVELREDLLSRNHQFKTKSDTEVLVHLYEEHGPDMLPLLNGMFAFALWDAKKRRLLLARDRMGVKPLYYANLGSRWFFASELKSFLTQPELAKSLELDEDSLADFLRMGYIPREGTPYRTVRKLLPGHSLMIDRAGGAIWQWWDLARIPARIDSEAEQRARIEELFDDAVRLRMRSDVPVASFLSGGLDSSLVTITAQRRSTIPINTYTIGFKHTEFDETPYARAVAEQEHTNHFERIVNPQDAVSLLPRLLWHMDEPMGDSSIIPNFLISQQAAENVKVCLSGLGGDELFGGYSRYEEPAVGRIRKVFRSSPFVAAALADWVDPWSHSHAEELRLASGESQNWRSYLHRLQIFDSRSLELLGFPAQGNVETLIEDLWNRYPGSDPVTRRQFVDQHTYLPDQILALTDRMSMANSLEVRVPFMDYRLVRFSQGIPTARKQTGGQFKIALKDALGKRCPPEIVSRPKWGFDTPLKNWVSQPDLFRTLRALESGELVRMGLVKPEGVQALTRTPETARNAARKVWNLLVLEVWMRVRNRTTAPTESLEELLEVGMCVSH